MSYNSCQHCGGPLMIAVYEDGQVVDVITGNCVAGDEMCRECFIKLLENINKEYQESQSLDGQQR